MLSPTSRNPVPHLVRLASFALPLAFVVVVQLAGCGTPDPIPRGKVSVEGRTKAGEVASQIDTALAAKDLTNVEALAIEIEQTDPYTPRHAMAAARARAALATRDGNPRTYDEAVKRADTAVEAMPDDPDLRIQRARLQYDRKYYGKALDDYKRAAELRPSDREARRGVAFCHHHLREPKGERKAWEALIGVAPDDADAHYFLAAVLLKSGEKGDAVLAEQHLRRAIEVAPTHHLALQALAYREWQKPDYAAAEALLLRAASAIAVTVEKTETAVPTEASAAAKGEAEVFFSLGAVQQAAGKLKEAETSYERSLGLDPLHPKASANLGLLLLSLGDIDQGLRRLRAAADQEKDKDVKEQIEDVIKAERQKLDSERDALMPKVGP